MKKRLRGRIIRRSAGVGDGPRLGVVRKIPLILVLTAALMVAMAVPAGATPPSDVQFEVETDFGPSPFTASGPAVNAGLVCASGTVENVFFQASGFQSNSAVNFQIVNRFTCYEAPFGEFFVKLQVRLLLDGSPATFTWNVVDGTGGYEDLHGAGTGAGLPCGTCFVLDVYDGGLHID